MTARELLAWVITHDPGKLETESDPEWHDRLSDWTTHASAAATAAVVLLDAIHGELHGRTWNADTHDRIAALLIRQAGYRIAEPDERPADYHRSPCPLCTQLLEGVAGEGGDEWIGYRCGTCRQYWTQTAMEAIREAERWTGARRSD